MRKQLEKLREKMTEHEIDVYIIPTADYHNSEYVNEFFKCREYVSGFTGSAGTLIVTLDWAGLWTDGRYFIQGEKQLKGSGISLMRMGEDGVPSTDEFLMNLEEGLTVGFDGKVIGAKQGLDIEKRFNIVWDIDIVGEIWTDRPKIKPSKIYSLPIDVTGEESKSKFKRLLSEMNDADYLLITSLDEIAWLYNLRGRDINHIPVFFAFALINKEIAGKRCEEENDFDSNMYDFLYVMDDNLIEKGANPYGNIFESLKALENCNVMMDMKEVSFYIKKCMGDTVNILNCKSPLKMMKAVKNQREIACTRKAHVKDGVALVKFIYWLKKNIGERKITEISVASYLERCRKEQGCYDLSFATIAGYEEHGAVIHYEATKETEAVIEDKGFLLVDSGGQYEFGTTDVTRTISLGEIENSRKVNYTAVLKGNLRLAMAKFKEKTTGFDLDKIARKPLLDIGLDFNHGTGHGVGHLLSVHEGPNVISRKGAECEIVPGMITSDEPGVYFEGEYGIRLENELLCVEDEGEYTFEILTYCPFDSGSILTEMLEKGELEFLNEYHRIVYEKISPYLNDEETAWLEKETKAI